MLTRPIQQLQGDDARAIGTLAIANGAAANDLSNVASPTFLAKGLAAGLAGLDLSNVQDATFLAKIREASGAKILTPQADFGVIANGADCTAGMTAFLNAVYGEGYAGYIPPGQYGFASQVTTNVLASGSVMAPGGVKFAALPGFPPGEKLLEFTSESEATDIVFEWDGAVDIDVQNMPYPREGFEDANTGFSIEGSNMVNTAIIRIGRMYAGPNWLYRNGDQLFFAGGIPNIFLDIGLVQGATDSAIYLSGDAEGVTGQNCIVRVNGVGCIDVLSIKRAFLNTIFDVTAVDCQNGGGAAGFSPLEGGYSMVGRVAAVRTERAAHFIACDTANITVTSKNVGVSVTGPNSTSYTSTAAAAAFLEGASNLSGEVVANGINPACTPSSSFTAVTAVQETFTPSNLNSINNKLGVVATGMGRNISEDTNCAGNSYTVLSTGEGASSVLAPTSFASVLKTDTGTLSTYAGDTCVGQVVPTEVAIGGAVGHDAFRVLVDPLNVNRIQAEGSHAGSGQAFLRAVGADTNVDLNLDPQGTGVVRFGTVTAIGSETLTSYITIKDAGGTPRKVAVVS